MTTRVFRLIVTGILMLGLAIPGAVSAGGGNKQCSIHGTWFGVDSLANKMPTGWVVTATGQSAHRGVNVFEFKTFDSSLFGLPEADDMSADRGVWKRLNGNTFAYSFMAVAVDETNAILYTARVSGEATLSSDCMSEEITALLEVFWPGNSPFVGDPDHSWQLPVHYGYRFTLN